MSDSNASRAYEGVLSTPPKLFSAELTAHHGSPSSAAGAAHPAHAASYKLHKYIISSTTSNRLEPPSRPAAHLAHGLEVTGLGGCQS